jgi:chromosomal replication initiator protein
VGNKELWQSVLGELEVKVTRASFGTWIKNSAIIERDNDRIIVGVPNIFSRRWLQDKFNNEIRESLARIDPTITEIEYKIIASMAGSSTTSTTKQTKKNETPANTHQASLPIKPISESAKNLNPKYNFTSFVVGSSNEMAYAACMAVAKTPGTKYNPLYLYGGVGLGKTHLMQAVGNEIVKRDPTKRIEYVTIETFTNEFIDAIQKKKNTAFTNKYRNVDVLIIDDMQFLAGKEKTQDEFFHTFNALYQDNKQIIISSDKPPQMLVQLEDRLKSRFAMGLIADIQPPDLETRSAIIQAKAASKGVELPLDVVDHLARTAPQSIRELEGSLTRLFAEAELRGSEPNLLMAVRVISSNPSGSKLRSRPLTAKLVIERVATYFDLMPEDITGTKRDREIVMPRQIVMYIMRQDMSLSFPKIAKAVGGRDHTTAMHSVTKISKQIENEDDLREDLEAIREQLSVR